MRNPPPLPIKIESKNDCQCSLVDGLFRRGKDGCKKLKSQHKF